MVIDMPKIKGQFKRIKEYFFGTKPIQVIDEQDMSGKCAKCEIMKMFLTVSKKAVVESIVPPEEPQQVQNSTPTNTFNRYPPMR